jgi:cytochrome c peroxidase
VFTLRMAGGEVPVGADQALGRWLDRIAPPSGVVADAQAVARGRALFEAEEQGCSGCHGGPLLTNNALLGVGTGGAFKVPSLLGIGARAPYMHDGCATTLRDRFGMCGGGDLHGHTSQLTSGQIDDLIAYLESL